MSRAIRSVLRATIASSIAALVACTANVQDLGAPAQPTDPLAHVDEACLQWPLHGKKCTADGPLTCNPTSTLQCVCGFDGTWVCLDGSLGLLSEHALETWESCATGVTYGSNHLNCRCFGEQLICDPTDPTGDRPSPPELHAP